MATDNSLEGIKKWVEETVAGSSLTDKEKATARDFGERYADKGSWRGDISDVWICMGFTNEQFNFELVR